MKVTLRQKALSDGRQSLYLDFYPPIPNPDTGKDTRREFLGLYLHAKPRTDLERTHNKQTRLLADTIRASRQLEVQAGRFGFLAKKAQAPVEQVDFLAWCRQQAQTRFETNPTKSRSNWLCLNAHLARFAGETIPADAVTEQFVRKFKAYMETATFLHSERIKNRRLSINSTATYFVLFKTAVKQAFQAGILPADVGLNVPSPKRREGTRTFLAMTELRAMAKAECDIPELKQAGLFSALTGLRYSDIEKLTWGELRDDPGGAYIQFTQQKTQDAETMPLSAQARALLGERGTDADRVFPNLVYSSHQNTKIQQWAARAGITRTLTFHCFRHTFATLQIQHGTDIYTVSKLLGHNDLKTTEIYAKIVDDQKRTAVNRLSLDL